jgi:hypothetical protein
MSAGIAGTPGVSWTGRVQPPYIFGSGGTGKWAFIQIINPGRWYTDGGGQHSWSINGLLGLDTSYPYPFWIDFPGQQVVQLDDSTYGKPDDHNDYDSSDSPSGPVDNTMTNYIVNEQFWTYMVYWPQDIGNGHQWVPLHRIHWTWSASVNRVGNSWANNGLPFYVGPVTVDEDARCKTHPIWNRVNDASAPFLP